jgi:hypothetical protein
VIRLDAATVLLQWATGGLAFLWVTSRRREVGIGYGWLLRTSFAVLAAGAVVAGRLGDAVAGRDVAATAVTAAVVVALAVSIVRRRAGVAGERARERRKSARVAAMVGGGDQAEPGPRVVSAGAPSLDVAPEESYGPEFPPAFDLVAPLIGIVGLVVAALHAGGPPALAVARTLVGAAFLGAVTDAMLLGHWYLVQPGLDRQPLLELIRWLALLWPVEIAVLLWPTGMLSVLSGSVDDGWGGTLGWFWVACAVTTLVLTGVTRAALRERYYSAVMAATGLLYLAILTAFGTDLVARAILA